MNTYLNRRLFARGLASVLFVGALPAVSFAAPRYDRAQVMEIVLREAVNSDFSLSLALAVAHVESNFNHRALSSKGARGVMQIMPATARGEYGVSAERLWDPRTNVSIGLHFLSRLIEGYDGRTDIALSHYNGGSAVRRGSRLRVIPATRKYVRKVNRYRTLYRSKILQGLG